MKSDRNIKVKVPSPRRSHGFSASRRISLPPSEVFAKIKIAVFLFLFLGIGFLLLPSTAKAAYCGNNYCEPPIEDPINCPDCAGAAVNCGWADPPCERSQIICSSACGGGNQCWLSPPCGNECTTAADCPAAVDQGACPQGGGGGCRDWDQCGCAKSCTPYCGASGYCIYNAQACPGQALPTPTPPPGATPTPAPQANVLGRVALSGGPAIGSCPSTPYYKSGSCSAGACPGTSCQSLSGLTVSCSSLTTNWSCNGCGAVYSSTAAAQGSSLTCTASGLPAGYVFKSWSLDKGSGTTSGTCDPAVSSCAVSFQLDSGASGAGDNHLWFFLDTAPTCTISGNTTVYVGSSGSWAATSVAPDAGSPGLEIDRNTAQSVTGLTRLTPVAGGSECSGNSCAITRSWTPTAGDLGTHYLFCRGYNDAIRECRPFSPFTYPADVDCGGTDWLTVQVKQPIAWFQTKEGDVHAGNDISDSIPSATSEPYFSLFDAGEYPGVVSYGGDSAYFGDGQVSALPVGWLANTSFGRSYYNELYRWAGEPAYEPPPADGVLNDSDFATTMMRAYSGDIQTGGAGGVWVIGIRKIVIFTTGKFLIKHKIMIDPGGSLVVVAQGDIGVSQNVSATGAVNSRLQGIFITDGTFYTSTDDNLSFSGSAPSNKMLVVDGMVVANSVNLGRDFSALGGGEYDNATTPTETFRYDPSLWINANPVIWRSRSYWQEVVP